MAVDALVITASLYTIGARGNRMYFINKGTCSVSVKGATIAVLTDGSSFGEIALIHAKTRRSATVTSMTYCELYILKKKDIDKVLSGTPEA